ncbi:MAG: DEAD/DEAH box helicase, partial [Anaerolineae bacterium]|nr:DEAD/DEAH box helicase [Anaerolineae bacterium]
MTGDSYSTDALSYFSAPVRSWFERALGRPTPPQAQGWPAIARGENTLILAPTGSGKTLTAFLWGIDEIYRELAEEGGAPNQSVRLLYISPLKALNNDIERNLQAPLAGIRAEAERLGYVKGGPLPPLPPLRTAVRTGDTPSHARASMVKRPPHILITTPESLYLILTSPRGRDMLRGVRSLIIDEIHTLVGEKRGAHLALSLERLEHLAGHPIQRIGLSATIRPLEEAARFLAGQDAQGQPRPVTIVDTGYKKPLDLKVVMPVEDFRDLPGDSIWPSVVPQVLGDIMRHRTTLVFANNRRLAERTADRLNAQIAAERSEEIEPGSTEALAPGGVMRDKGIFALGVEGPIKAHHGSASRESRREMEEALKKGKLPALVSTGTLELGIDIGHVDLVVQLQAPRSVAQGLQRVGRSGHLVGQTSKGRIYATHREDLVEAAAVARGMLDGAVEPVHTPSNALDVLSQQVIAAVAVDEWDAESLYALVCRAYPYRDLSRSAWESVLGMVSGRFQQVGGPGHGSLQARIHWDRANNRLTALPGTRLLALNNPGAIPDTGAYDVYLPDGKTRVGTLDEEFIF